jgi:ornithine lipid ester-linked acyl 2-hydroxylase
MAAIDGSNSALEKVAIFFRQVIIRVFCAVEKFLVPKSFSRVENTPFIDPRQFEWNDSVTAEWTTVQRELKALLSTVETIPEWGVVTDEKNLPITEKDTWRTYFFYVYGQRFEKQCSECPETARLLAQIPGMKTALFSIMEPGTRITPHRGPYRGVLRYHLPLIVPEGGKCGIRVGGEDASWEEGVAMMFDDTYEHEAWNESQETRVVLFLDITRPMKFPYNILNSTIIGAIGQSPSVRQIRKKQAEWDRSVAQTAAAAS